MQSYVLSSLALSLASLFMHCVGKVYYVYWHRPKTLEKFLRNQGLQGTSYSPFHDDLKQMARSTEEAGPEPEPAASLDHRIVQRVRPLLQQMVHKYGKVCLSWIETRPSLIVADPELIKVVLADKNGHFVKPPSNPLVDLLQHGVSTLEGEKWAKRRKLITPAFHFEKLKGMIPAFSMSCCDLIDRLKELTNSQGSCEVDVATELQNLTADIISRSAFGSSYEEGKKIFELQKEQAVLVLEAYFSLYLPGFSLLPTKKNKRRYYLDQQIKLMIRTIIRQKEKVMQNGESCTNDLLGLLLQCRGAENDMTIEDVVEECKLFYFAGQETTANWLTWTMVVLSMHPEWQEKAREEVLQVCGDRIPDIDEINHLKICILVSSTGLSDSFAGIDDITVMRLYPPVTALYRHTCKNTTLGGMSIPDGVDILLPTLLLHFDPKLWGDDADEFRPERFTNGISNASKHQLAFYPFGWGPRICLGQNFSTIEAKMALAMILQNFEFQLSPAYVHAPHTVITLQPQHGAPMILRRVQPFGSL